MKTIALRIVEVPMDGKTVKLSYKAQLAEIVRTPSNPQGADYSEVRNSIRILDALEKSDGETLELEDADFEYLKKRILSTRWQMIDHYVLQFIDDVTG